MRTSSDLTCWVLIGMLQTISLRPIFKYVPEKYQPIIPACILAGLLATFLVYTAAGPFRPVRRIMDNRMALIGLCICLLLANYFLYPIADGLKIAMRGSDQDDALIDAGVRLISGENPYNGRTYLGNPISAGPGWVILLLPFTVTHLYFMVTPVFVTISGLLVNRLTGSPYKGNLFLALLMSSLGFWDLMVVGSDLWALGCALLFCLTLLFSCRDKQWFHGVAVAFVVAMVVSSRIVFAYVIPILGVFLWKSDRTAGMRFVLSGLAVLVGIHFLFYVWAPEQYAPLHLLYKGNELLAGKLGWACMACTAAALLYAAFAVQDSFDSWLFNFWLCLIVPMVFVSAADLTAKRYALSLWEGSNYLAVAVPVYLTYACLRKPQLSS